MFTKLHSATNCSSFMICLILAWIWEQILLTEIVEFVLFRPTTTLHHIYLKCHLTSPKFRCCIDFCHKYSKVFQVIWNTLKSILTACEWLFTSCFHELDARRPAQILLLVLRSFAILTCVSFPWCYRRAGISCWEIITIVHLHRGVQHTPLRRQGQQER